MSTDSRPSREALEHYAKGFNASLTMRSFGCAVSFPTDQRVMVTMPVRPEHRGGLGSSAVNGGVIAAMFDLAIGCTPALVDPTKRTATMQLSMTFERAVTGDVFTVESWIDTQGKSTLFSSAILKDEQGRVCARCTGLAKLSKVPWASGQSPATN